MDDKTVTRVALALREEARSFMRPVPSYVEEEARHRWEQKNHGKDAILEGPPLDWEMESWKILARVAIVAQG